MSETVYTQDHPINEVNDRELHLKVGHQVYCIDGGEEVIMDGIITEIRQTREHDTRITVKGYDPTSGSVQDTVKEFCEAQCLCRGCAELNPTHFDSDGHATCSQCGMVHDLEDHK